MITNDEDRLREENPQLHRAIVQKIHLAPDPRPITVIAAYNEKWSSSLAWSRLLHELNALSIEERDAEFLDKLQQGVDGKLDEERHLTRRMTAWLELYPMITWSLQFTAPMSWKIVHIVMGNVAGFLAKDITMRSVDYIRDLSTARTLRRIRGSFKLIPENINNLIKMLYKEKLGRIYWILASVDAISTDRKLMNSIMSILIRDDDDEFLIPFVEQNVFDLNNAIYSDDHDWQKRKTPSSLAFSRFFRYIFDRYIISTSIDSHKSPNIINFLETFWGKTSYNIDDEFALYISTRYLEQLLLTGQTYKPFLIFFEASMYVNIWRLVIDYVAIEAAENIDTVGAIALESRAMTNIDISSIYKTAFQNELSLNYNTSTTNEITRQRIFKNDRYLYDDLSATIKIHIFLASDIKWLNNNDYEEILRESNHHYLLQRNLMIKIIGGNKTRWRSPIADDFDLILIIVRYILPKNYYRIFITMDNSTIVPAYLKALGTARLLAEKDKYFNSLNSDTSFEVIKTLIGLLGVPSQDNLIKMFTYRKPITNILELISRENLITLAGELALYNAIRVDTAIILPYIQYTGITITEMLGNFTKNFYTQDWLSGDYVVFSQYSGTDLNWNLLFNHYRSNTKTPIAENVKILFKHTQVDQQIIAYYLQGLLSLPNNINKSNVISFLATPSIMKFLTPGLQDEIHKVINKIYPKYKASDDDLSYEW